MRDVYPIVHILAAVVLMGHMLYWATIAGALRKSVDPWEGDQFLLQLVRRSGWTGWVCLGVLIVTGLFMLSNWHVNLQMVTSGQFFQSRFGKLLTLKVLGMAIIIAGFFVMAPGRVKLVQFNFLMGLIVILLSILLVR
jgi:hypothetical protein